MSWLLRKFGFKIVYVCAWGTYDTRYDGVDAMMCRAVHPGMSTAPPWAKAKIVRIS